jgi:hypothetical protein
MIYETWYPFNATKSPAYELVIIAQVWMSPVKYLSTVWFILNWAEYSVYQSKSMSRTLFIFSECFIAPFHDHIFCL